MQRNRLSDHLILTVGVVIMMGPVVWLLVQTTLGLWQTGSGLAILNDLVSGRGFAGAGLWVMIKNSVVLAAGTALVQALIAVPAAYALVFFRVRGAEWIFGVILLTMFFPVETRVLPTFLAMSELGLLNSYGGMILPVAASGTGVLVLRQHMRQIPSEVLEAARLDGAGPLKILVEIIAPMSLPMVVALMAMFFVLGWNQYLWPLMITTTSQDHDTLVRGLQYAGSGSLRGMILALIALMPPAVVLLACQRHLLRGLTAGVH